MARNFEGLGIGIEAEDDGSEKKLQGLSDTVNNLWGGLKKASGLAPTLGRKLGRGLGRMGQQGAKTVGLVTTAIGGMIDKAMSPELDTAYSSMFTGFNKSFSAMVAGMKISEKEMKEARKIIGGAAFGMAEDMEGTAKSWAAFRQQNVDLIKVLGADGLSGAVKDLIKVTSVFDMEGEQLAIIAGGLTKGFGFTEEAVGSLADKIVAVGREFNIGREALQAWPAIFESINNEMAAFGKQLSPEEVENLTLSIVQLGGGLQESLGVGAQQSLEIARTLFTTLIGERKNIHQMFVGMGGEFGEVAKNLMETGGDVNKVFEMITKGDPLKFMDMLREMGREAKARGGETGIAFERMAHVMDSALGADVAWAVKGNWDKVSETMANMPGVIAGAKGTLKEVADAHWKSTITAGEAWDRMMQTMKAQLFRLSNKEIRAWQKNMKRGFKTTFGVISDFAKDKGPLGELTRRLLAVQRVGLSALIPGLSSLAPLLGGIATSALPVLTALGAMGMRFSDLGKFAIAGGGLWLVFKLLTDGPDKVIEQFSNMKEKIKEVFEKRFIDNKKFKKNFPDTHAWLKSTYEDIQTKGLIQVIKDKFKEIKWGELWGTVWGTSEQVLRSIGKFLADVDWAGIVKTAFTYIGRGISALGGAIWGSIFGEEAEQGAVGSIQRLLEDAFRGAIDIVKKTVKGAITGLWESVFDPESISGTLKNVVKLVTGTFATLLVLSKSFRAKMMGIAGSGISRVMTPPMGGAGAFFGGVPLSGLGVGAAGKGMLGAGKAGLGKALGGAKAVGKMMAPIGALMGAMEAANQVSIRAQTISEISTSKILSDQEKMALKSEEAFKGVTSTIDSMFMGLPSLIGRMLGISSDDLSDFYQHTVATVEAQISTIVGFFGFLKDAAWDSFKWVGSKLTQLWVWIGEKVNSGLGYVVGKIYDFGEMVHKGMSKLASWIMYPFEWLGFKLKGWIAEVIEGMFGTEQAPTWLGDIVKKFGDEETFAKISDTVKQLRKEQRQFLGGEKTFTDAYEKKMKASDEETHDLWEGMRETATFISDTVEGGLGKAGKAAEDIADKSAANLGGAWSKFTGDVVEYSSASYAEADKAIRARAKHARGQTRMTATEEVEETAAKPKGGGRNIPSAEERAKRKQEKKDAVALEEVIRKQEGIAEDLGRFIKTPIVIENYLKVDKKVLAKSVDQVSLSGAARSGRAVGGVK